MKRIILFLFSVLQISSIIAQQEAQHSFYFFNPLEFNPAYAGSREYLNITSVNRAQWLGWDGAPKTSFLSIQSPVARQKIGLGATLLLDQIGARSRLYAKGNFAYHLPLNDNGLRLSFGLSMGIQQERLNFSNLLVSDQTDPNYVNANNSLSTLVGSGIYLHGEKFYIGAAVPKTVQLTQQNNTQTVQLAQHFYLMSGYVKPINSVIDLKPSVLLKYVEHAPLTIDLNVSAFFYKQVWLGALYRVNEAIGINTAYQLSDRFMLGYAFDYPINGMRTQQWGNHELVLTLEFKSKKRAFISPRYF
jgi:type IX secretion system PorP/SprF family membrane protein